MDFTQIQLKINNYLKDYNFTWEKEGKEIVKENKTFFNNEEKFIINKLLFKKMPQKFRRNFWLISSGARLMMLNNVGYYNKLLIAYNKLISEKHPFYLQLERKISVDLNRSFGTLNASEIEINKLKNILHAFVVRNVSINYMQGLNQIVVNMLLHTNFNEEESFFLFVKLIEDYTPLDYFLYCSNIELDLNIIPTLIKNYSSKLYDHMENIGGTCMITSNISMWLVSLLYTRMNKDILDFFMDCIYYFSGNYYFSICFIYNTILSVFKILDERILDTYDMISYSKLMETFEYESLSDFNFKKLTYFTIMDENRTKPFDIVKLRQKASIDFIKNKILKFNASSFKEITCKKYYPICYNECSVDLKTTPFVVYKISSNINDFYIENYLDKTKDEINKIDEDINKNDDKDVLNNLLIDRRIHTCPD